MFKKLGIVLGSAVVIGLVGLLVASAAFAQGSTPTATTTPQTGAPQGKLGLQGRGAPGAGGPNGGMDEIAKLLNMTPDQIWAERVLGKTISDLAKEKGVSDQQLVDALVASQKTHDRPGRDRRTSDASAGRQVARMVQAVGRTATDRALCGWVRRDAGWFRRNARLWRDAGTRPGGPARQHCSSAADAPDSVRSVGR